MYYQVEEMNGYYRIGSQEQVYSYLLVGEDKALLIDTGYGFYDLKSVVRSLTQKPLIIVNTHGHCDHTGGNAQFDEICYIHEADLELCREHNSYEMRKSNALRSMHTMDYETGAVKNILPDGFDIEAYAGMGAGRLKTVREGDVFDLGGVTAEILETPGHTKGGISVLYREQNLIFIGDAAGFFVWLFLPESTGKDAYIRMLDKLSKYNAVGYIGAHCPDIMKKEDLAVYRKAAETACYEKGEPFQSFLDGDKKPHVCPLNGMSMKDMFRPGFASVVIDETWGK